MKLREAIGRATLRFCNKLLAAQPHSEHPGDHTITRHTDILIANTDNEALRCQATLLRNAGYRVATATTGAEALQSARDVHPDLVLLGHSSPQTESLATCRRMKADPALEGCAILLTGDAAGPPARAEALEAGAAGLVEPTAGDAALLSQVDAILRAQKAERELRTWRARYHDLAENVPIGIYRTKPEGEIVTANPALVHMLGYDSFKELAQRNLEDESYHPDYPRSRFKRQMAEVGQVVGLESAWRRKDGSTLFVRENARPIYDDDGKLAAYQGTVEDVTDHVERKERLHRLNALLDAVGDINQLLVREDDPGELIKRACQCLVQTPSYQTAWIALLDEDGTPRDVAHANLSEARDAIVQGLETEQPDLCGLPALSRPGLWAASAPHDYQPATVYRNQDVMGVRLEHAGQVYGLMTVSMQPTLDVDDRERDLFEEVADDIAFALYGMALERQHRAADQALKRNKRRLSLILDATTEHIIYHNKNLEIQWANRAAAASVALQREELVGRRCYEVWAQRQEPCADCPVLKALETGVPHQAEQLTPDGRVWIVRGYPVFDERGEIEGLVEFTQDVTERKQAHQALHESESRFRRLFDSNMIAITYWNSSKQIVEANDAYLSMLGYTRRDLEDGKLNWRELTPPEYADVDDQGMAEIDQHGVCTPYEKEYVRKDGTRVPVLIGGASLEGDQELGISYAVDITERKQAEEHLAVRRQLWDALMANTPDLVYFKDADHGMIRASQAYADAVGLDHDEMIGRTAAELWPREGDRIMADERRVLEGESIIQKEREATNAAGEPRSYLLTKVPIYQDGEVVGFFAIDKDITERKQAEEQRERLAAQIQDQAQRMGHILATVPEAVMLLDGERRVVHANPTARKHLALLADADVGDVLTHLGDRELAELLTSPPKGLWHEVAAGERTIEFIARPMQASAADSDGHQSEAEHWVLVGKDVTRERHIRRQLQLQERLAAVGQLAAGIAHDFNNTLGAIILYAQMPLRAADLSPVTKEALETILDESRRAADLIQQILDFSRSSMMETETLELSPVIDETLAILHRTIPESIHLVTDMTSAPCIADVDPTRIHQVLINLALNARDAMPRGGELRVELERIQVTAEREAPVAHMAPGAWARLTVSDTGVGMSRETQDHLFEPFYTTKEKGRGTGLGLAQVYGIVKQHTGFIDVETAVGEGTMFTIFLPLAEEKVGIPFGRQDSAALRGRGETILIAEDAERLRCAVEAGLESLGYRVLSAADGSEALQILAGQNVDLVLTDVVMPEMGGEALLRRLQREDHPVPVIAMTGHVLGPNTGALRRAGFDRVITKPFSIEDLTRTIRGVLDGA